MATRALLQDQTARLKTLQSDLRHAFDPFGLVATTLKAQHAWLTHPTELAGALAFWYDDFKQWGDYTWRRWLGQSVDDVFRVHPEDARFADADWTEHPAWDSLKEWYLFNTRWLQDSLFATPALTQSERNRSAFWLRQWLNAVAPNNYFFLNPVAMAKALETRGDSLAKGLQNLARDAQRGEIAMTDPDAFRVGENLALTPGSVVYRGPLLEVIHYDAVTPDVYKIPLVIVPPWINKYYVLDLDAKKSMVKYLTEQGFSVFIASWVNPGPSAADVSFDDYITNGIDKIVEVAQSISGSDTVNLTGYCIGGTLVATYLAWLAKRGDAQKINSATLLTSLTDFSKPGDIDIFLDEEGLAFVERTIAQKGYLDGREMAASFRMLRPNSLVWNYWVSNYLLGETPMAFDVLYWNMDTTRMPQKMHCYYLREFYFHNRLIKSDVLTIAGESIDLSRIETPLFMVSTEEDHIAPWQQTWALTRLAKGPVTFTLSSSGHILGIVNPPAPTSKRNYRQAGVKRGQAPEEWVEHLQKVAGSWWPSWSQWLQPLSGSKVKPKLSNRQYPRIMAAPGQYVME
ncbi:PHA/PHB synthase family protein [Silvimonas amylolytica]|uniref:Class I poly(R)-hydroxyalkanoic acid synthase n=1 Tax=Silvimonas amylolytica TaxID=449663 RepID=A0ABQ2PR93_9NEIS|nr:alpha/beta fold hydrolase [Silvimonas amylolytica]GGP27696.1 class I poly(R)-hydroxyalkanoic acid synthase [Silvimonas amylolytica]